MTLSQRLWNFGDGTTSTEANPTHTYKNPGVFTVRCDYQGYTGVSGTFFSGSITKEKLITVFNGGNDSSVITNKSFRYGLTSSQGVGFSENTGSDWVFPEGRTGTVMVYDNNKQPHLLVLNYSDGKFYDISTRDSAASSNIVKVWQDKVDISGIAGTDICPKVRFRETTGTFEKFFIRTASESIYTRPVDKIEGYPSGITFDVSQYVDDKQTKYKATTKDIKLPKQELVFDRQVEGHRIITEVVTNKAKVQIVGREMDYISYDRSPDPITKISSEDTWQQNISLPTSWISRGGNQLVDKATGSTLVGNVTYITGVDGKGSSAITITTPIQLVNNLITSGTLMLWCGLGYTIPGITLITIGGFDDWFLCYATGSIPANITLPNGNVFDVRLYSTVLDNDTMQYYMNDCVDNYADNVCKLF